MVGVPMSRPQKIALLCFNDIGVQSAEYIKQKDKSLKIFKKERSQTSGDYLGPLFTEYNGLVFFGALGIALRMIAPFVKDKYSDPAVVVVDNGCRYVISLLSGHEGGANKLAYYIAGLISAVAVITTATESRKSYVLGIGSVAGIEKSTVIGTVTDFLSQQNVAIDELRLAATIPRKYKEKGIREAMEFLAINLVKIEEEQIDCFSPAFHKTAASKHLAIPAVAEPCALLASREGRLLGPVKKIKGLTLALAKERMGPL